MPKHVALEMLLYSVYHKLHISRIFAKVLGLRKAVSKGTNEKLCETRLLGKLEKYRIKKVKTLDIRNYKQRFEFSDFFFKFYSRCIQLAQFEFDQKININCHTDFA